MTQDAAFSLPVASLRIVATAIEPLTLPPNAGSTLRGAFGHALRAVGCIDRGDGALCIDACLENKRAMTDGRPTSCSYGYLFDTPRPPGSPFLERQSEVPHPYVFRSVGTGGRAYMSGERVEFQVNLLGMGIACLPEVVEACIFMGRGGIGKGRGRFTLDEVWEQAAFDTERRLLPLNADATALSLVSDWNAAALSAQRLSRESVTLQFLTSTCLVNNGVATRQPSFGIVMRALLRRLTLLALFHGGIAPVDRFKRLATLADGVRLIQWEGAWQDWQRYSSRQQQHQSFGGLVGSAVYEGEVEPFLSYLIFGQAVHLGKACTFGSGQYLLHAGAEDGLSRGVIDVARPFQL